VAVATRNGTLGNLVDSHHMTEIIFRLLPGVINVEQQLEMQFRGRMLDDELEELPHLIDDTSVRLFGITHRDTFYWALPNVVRRKYSRAAWDENFDVLGRYSRDPNQLARVRPGSTVRGRREAALLRGLWTAVDLRCQGPSSRREACRHS
jgi:hypothetical protein